MHIKFGSQHTFYASNAAVATEILKTNDRHLSSARAAPPSVLIDGQIQYSLLWNECNDYWKSLRKVCRTELFTTRMLDSQSQIREKKVMDLMNFLKTKQGQIVQVSDVVFVTLLNLLSNMIFSKDMFLYEGEDEKRGMKYLIRDVTLTAVKLDISELFPILRPLDLQGIKRGVNNGLKPIFGSWAETVRDRKESKDHSRHDFLDVLIQGGFSDQTLDGMILEMLGAGSETTTSTIEWTLTELLRHPHMLKKLREELQAVVGDRPMKESDLPKLPYLHACIKETLRLHPPAPFLIPRRSTETCTVLNYTIPKGSQILVNAYAIHRDPDTWERPLDYWPERFIGSELDYQGNHLQFIPFGAGRRICIGLPLGSRATRMVLGSLVKWFDWELPNGMEPDKLPMTESFGLTLQMDPPLFAIPKYRT
ncbi:hypothetical protein MRB53_013609 [Persea americana]|uniref:Uncharacterized protein n=1 Tax=Persea americana TaxID=3435 RepID=A0ACC2K8G3_PERAE|nr:hypothetical protein MRB53_013609 [Persea americana]